MTNLSDAVPAPANSLRAALAAANDGDTITFGRGIAPGTINLVGSLNSIDKNITISCAPAGGITVKGITFSVFDISAGKTCEIVGLQIQNPNNACAINNAGSLTLRTDTITNCEMSGIRNIGGSLSMYTCTVNNNGYNGAQWGGNYGGGIYIAGGNATLDQCTITGNTATLDGGGIYIKPADDGTAGTVTLSMCSVTCNHADGNGGGVYNNGYQFYVTGSNSPRLSLSTDLMNNTAGTNGGGLFQTGSAAYAYFDGATIGYNTATGQGGGCYFDGGTAEFRNYCLISGNQATVGSGIAYKSSVNLYIDPTCTVNDNVTLVT